MYKYQFKKITLMTGFVFQGHIYGISDTGSVVKLLMLAQRATPRPLSSSLPNDIWTHEKLY